MPLQSIADMNYEYTELLAPRTLEPNPLWAVASTYPEAEGDPTQLVNVKYTGGQLHFILPSGLLYQDSVSMIKPDKVDAAFDHSQNLVYAWLLNNTLYIGDQVIDDVSGFALYHEDLRFDANPHRALLTYTSGTSIFQRSSIDGFASEVELDDVLLEGEFLYAAGCNENYRMQYTFRAIENLETPYYPNYLVTAGDRIVRINKGSVGLEDI